MGVKFKYFSKGAKVYSILINNKYIHNDIEKMNIILVQINIHLLVIVFL